MKRTLTLVTGLMALLSFAPGRAEAQLAGGAYTINKALPSAGTNYNSFNDAVSAMSSGITGAVTFNVVSGSGPYDEQVIIPVIAGTSASNTITFNGNNNTLNYASSTSTERATLKLNGADYITIRKLDIKASGATYGFAVQLINDADYNTIDSCSTSLLANTFSYSGICINGNASSANITNSFCDNNTISNNNINGGYYGITLVGDAAARITNNKIVNNTLVNSYFVGIYVMGSDQALIENNDLSRPSIAALGSYYGIQLNSGNINARVSKNKIHNFFGSLTGTSPYAAYGLYSFSNATAGNENIFSNNIIYDMNGDGAQYAIYNTGASYNHYYNNTVSCDNTASVSGNTFGFYQQTAASGIVFKNNLISITRGGTGNKACIYMNTAATTFTADNNDYYINTTQGTNNIGRVNGVDYATLAAWRTGGSQDASSVTIAPLFTAPSSGNLMPNSSALDNKGVPVTGITTDINNVLRNTTTPDIGAYEFSAPVISVTGNTAICTGNTSALTGTPVGGSWASSNTAAATVSSAGVVTALSAGTSVITYTTATGFATITVAVGTTPTVAPITGTLNICSGATTNLSNSTPGGVWTSSNQFIAPISNTGLVDGVGSGTVTITYTVTNGNCTASSTVTVNINSPTVPQNTGENILCEGDYSTLSNTVSGGVWSSNTPTIVTIASNGVLHGLAAGQAQISYTVTNAEGCSKTVLTNVTINAKPVLDSIEGTASVCFDGTTTLSNNIPDGTWSSSDATIATIDTAGIVTALQPGTVTISYTVVNPSKCSTTVDKLVTVNALPVPVIGVNKGVLSVSGTYTTYQWFKEMSPLGGATQSTYTMIDSGSYTVQVTDENGCIGNAKAVEAGPEPEPLGINGVSAYEGKINIYPNPTKDKLNIRLEDQGSGTGEIYVSDATGRIMTRQQLQNGNGSINVSAYADGVYFLRFSGEKGLYISRFNVVH